MHVKCEVFIIVKILLIAF